MTKPRGDLLQRRRCTESSDGAQELVLRVECERSKASLHVRPEALDGIQLWAVGREVDGDAVRAALRTRAASRIASRTISILWMLRLSMTTMSPG